MKALSVAEWQARETRFDALSEKMAVTGLDPAETDERRKLQKLLAGRRSRQAARGKAPAKDAAAKVNLLIKQEELKRRQMENGKLQGRLADVGEFRREWAGFIAELRTGLEALPARFKMAHPDLSPEGLAAFKQCLEHLARDMGFIPPKGKARGRRKATGSLKDWGPPMQAYPKGVDSV